MLWAWTTPSRPARYCAARPTVSRAGVPAPGRGLAALPRPAGRFHTRADRMRRYLTHRLLSALFVLVGVSFVVFLALHLAPGDPAQVLLGPMATPTELGNLRAQFGLDRPMIVQYGRWAARAARGDLGRSIMLRRPVLPELAASPTPSPCART